MKVCACCFLFVFLAFFKAKGQSNEQIVYHFKTDTVSVAGEKTFSNALIITNRSLKDATLLRKGESKHLDNAILMLPETMMVKAGETVSFPLKYFADSKTIVANIQLFELKLQSNVPGLEVQESAAFYTQLMNADGLVLDTQSPEIYLDPVTNKADLQVRVFNEGLIPLTFMLDLTEIPKGLEFIGTKSKITLEAGAEQLLPFVAVNKSKNNGPADFRVVIRALGPSGNQMASKRIRVMTLSSNRNLVLNEQDIYYQNRPNSISLNYTTANNYKALQLFGSGKIRLDSAQKILYNFSMNYSPLIGGELSSSGSHITYENKYLGIRVGNIFENLDFNIYGRGIKGSAFLDKERTLNVYALQSNPYLFSSNKFAQQRGSSFALEYINNAYLKEKSRLVLLQNKDASTNMVTRLISGSLEMLKSKNENLNIGAGYSLQSFENNKNIMAGLGLELSYDLRGNNSIFSTTNYFSTPNYGGNRRGSFFSENKLVFSLDRKNDLIARLSLSDNRPNSYYREYNQYVKMTNQYSNQTFELGYEKAVSNWRIGLFPYYFGQQMEVNQIMYGNKEKHWKSISARARLDVSYGDAAHYVNMNIDNGYTFQNTSGLPPAPFFSSRVNLSYRNNIFGFTSFYQYKSFYLSDALAYSGGQNSNMFAVGPNAGFSAFRRRMSFTGSLMYSYYGYNSNQNYSLNAYSRYLLRGDWALTMNLNYDLNRQERLEGYNPQTGIDYRDKGTIFRDVSYFSNRLVSLGVEKQFGKVGTQIKKLTLTYFEDLNGNGLQDKGERFIPGVLIKINNLAAITNQNGSVEFSAPPGDYEVLVVNQNGWSTLGSNSILLTKDKRLKIGLVKTLKLSGSFDIKKNEYAKTGTALSGVRVSAVGENGDIHSTICRANGDFSFYLAEGKYLIYIKDIPESFKVLTGKQEVSMSGKGEQKVTFRVEDQHVKVDVKEF